MDNDKYKVELLPSTRLIFDELSTQSNYVRIIDPTSSLLEYEDGNGVRRYIFSTLSDKTSAVGLLIARNKHRTSAIATELGIPVPDSRLCSDYESALSFLLQHSTIVLKPLDKKGGAGVTTEIRTESSLKKAFAYAQAQSLKVIAQKHLTGSDVRLLIVGGYFISAVIRSPAIVIGNGSDPIKTLIKLDNSAGVRNEPSISSLMSIDYDSAKRYLGEQMNYVPEDGLAVQVVGPANVSLGGSIIEASHIVTEEMKQSAELISKRLGLGICGVDMIWDRSTNSYGLIELNAVPGIDIHDDPFSETTGDAPRKYVEWLMS